MTTPSVPTTPSSTTPRSVALVSWVTSTSSSTELSVSVGFSSIFTRRAAPLRPSSSSAIARTRFMRTNAVSASARKIEIT